MVSNTGAATVSVLLNRGGGTGKFKPQVAYPAGNAPGGIAIGDIDGDGKPDIVVADGISLGGQGTLSVLLNSGKGTFAAPVQMPAGVTPRAVVIGDLNNDGWNDCVVANQGGTLNVRLNNGQGALGPSNDIRTDGSAESIVAGDFNGDGRLDLAVAFDGGHGGVTDGVAIYLNSGNGTFAKGGVYATGVSPWQVVAGDLNGDGKPDLAVATRYGRSASVLLGRGDGTFSARVDYPAGDVPESVAMGDLNGDGKVDLAVTNSTANLICILPGRGDGTFGYLVCRPLALAPRFVVAADFNGDGRLDLASLTGGYWSTDAVSMLLQECN